MRHEAPKTFYKTAEQLDLPHDVYEALIKVRDMLESGEIIEPPPGFCDAPIGKFFRYAIWMENYTCGTAACIGGWIEQCLKGKSIVRHNPWKGDELLVLYGGMPFQRLLYGPFKVGVSKCRGVNIKEAIVAINNYLTTGEPMWKSVVPGAMYWPAHFGDSGVIMRNEDGGQFC